MREGLVKREIDARAGRSDTAVPAKKARPAYSTPLCRSLAHHKSLAVQSLLLADRRKAKEVAAVLLLGASDAYEPPLRLKPHDSIRTFANADSPPALSRRRAPVPGLRRQLASRRPGRFRRRSRLGAAARRQEVRPRALRGGQGARRRGARSLLVLLPLLCFGQGDCERLDTEDSLFNRVARDLQADMRDHWRPDAEFLTRRTREQLLEIAAESGLSLPIARRRSPNWCRRWRVTLNAPPRRSSRPKASRRPATGCRKRCASPPWTRHTSPAPRSEA